MADAAPDRFLRRPQGQSAAPLPDSGPDIARAERVVLRAADGNVLVKSVHANGDGTFSGEVYGVMPRQHSVAMGETVTFEEAHIFTFRAPNSAAAHEDPELADMERTFNALFSDAPQAPKMRTPAPRATEPAFGDVELPAPGRDEPRQEPVFDKREIAPPPAQEEMSLEDALAVLGAKKTPPEVAPRVEAKKVEPPETEPERVEPPRIEPRAEPAAPPRIEPAFVAAEPTPEPYVPAPPEPSPPAPPPVENAVIQCIECSAPIVVKATVDADGQTSFTGKVSCGRCGRINDASRAARNT